MMKRRRGREEERRRRGKGKEPCHEADCESFGRIERSVVHGQLNL